MILKTPGITDRKILIMLNGQISFDNRKQAQFLYSQLTIKAQQVKYTCIYVPSQTKLILHI